MTPTGSASTYPLTSHVLSAVAPRRLRWFGPWLPKMAWGWQDLKRTIPPLRIRWGWAVLVAIIIVLVMGECGPAASAIAALP